MPAVDVFGSIVIRYELTRFPSDVQAQRGHTHRDQIMIMILKNAVERISKWLKLNIHEDSEYFVDLPSSYKWVNPIQITMLFLTIAYAIILELIAIFRMILIRSGNIKSWK